MNDTVGENKVTTKPNPFKYTNIWDLTGDPTELICPRCNCEQDIRRTAKTNGIWNIKCEVCDFEFKYETIVTVVYKVIRDE